MFDIDQACLFKKDIIQKDSYSCDKNSFIPIRSLIFLLALFAAVVRFFLLNFDLVQLIYYF